MDYKNRVTELSWGTIKDMIPSPPKENNLNLPPELGYVVDRIRDNFSIYINVWPRKNRDLDNVNRDTIFEWVGDIYKVDGNKIKWTYTISGTNYTKVIRDCIDKAVSWQREQNELTSNKT